MNRTNLDYDVIIMGGGPAGSTLASLLRKDSSLRVAIIEKETFPREHIGESFAHRVIPILAESGALEKVLESDCWIKKFGGYYVWDYDNPSATFFDHKSFQKDGIPRWSIHVDRAKFDKILLDHARDSGTAIFENHSVLAVNTEGEHSTVTISGDKSLTCKYFIEASGRKTSTVDRRKKKFLSDYKNVAIWQHITGGKSAESVDATWNIFRENNLSAIGSFAFEDGWFWYIPVPKEVDGKRIISHSLGLVTDPRVLSREGNKYRDAGGVLEAARKVPILKDLVADAKTLYEEPNVATNYSMISERFCDFDERWMLIGDAAHFVDPLFSSGVAFAVVYAATASLLIRSSYDDSLNDERKRELWNDFNDEWQSVARSFALAIDQWYAAIAEKNPESVYWNERTTRAKEDVRDVTFHALVDTEISPDLLHVLSTAATTEGGPLAQVRARLDGEHIEDDSLVSWHPKLSVRESSTIEVNRSVAETERSEAYQKQLQQFWADPVAAASDISSFASPLSCHRFYLSDDENSAQIKFFEDRDGGLSLFGTLNEGPKKYSALRDELPPEQLKLLHRMHCQGMVRVTR